jgi:hypothetical protein
LLAEEPIPTTSARPDLPIEGQLKDLQKKLVVAQSIRHQGARVQRIKQLKKEIALIRKLTGKDKEVRLLCTLISLLFDLEVTGTLVCQLPWK